MIHQLEDVESRVSQTSQPGSQGEGDQTLSVKFCRYVEEKPTSSVLIGLGIGLGSSRYFAHNEAFIERIGNNVKDSLAEMIPSSFKKHFRS
jgi:hypothetical protein